MSTNLKTVSPGASYRAVGMGRKLPAADRARAWFEFSDGDQQSLENHVVAGAKGGTYGTPVFSAAGFTGSSPSAGGYFSTGIPQNAIYGAEGNTTLVATLIPGTAGNDSSIQFAFGGYFSGGNYQPSPNRFALYMGHNVLSNYAANLSGNLGYYDPTTPAANGSAVNVINGLAAINPIQPIMVFLEYLAATRQLTMTARNSAARSPAVVVSTTIPVGSVPDIRSTMPMQIFAGSATVCSAGIWDGALSAAEKNALFGIEQFRLLKLPTPITL